MTPWLRRVSFYVPIGISQKGLELLGRVVSYDANRYYASQLRGGTLAVQLDMLQQCDKVFQEKICGVFVKRPRLEAWLESVREADTGVVTRLDSVARSTLHLCQIAAELERKHVSLRLLFRPQSLLKIWIDSFRRGMHITLEPAVLGIQQNVIEIPSIHWIQYSAMGVGLSPRGWHP